MQRIITIICAVSVLFVLCPHSHALQTSTSKINFNHRHRTSSAISTSISPIRTCQVSNRCNNNIQRRRIKNKYPSVLFSSPSESNELQNSDDNNIKKSPKKKWQQLIRSLLRAFITFPTRFRTYFGKLTKAGKIVLSCQLMAMGLILGVGAKRTSDIRSRTANRPVEVSYSTFLDLVGEWSDMAITTVS